MAPTDRAVVGGAVIRPAARLETIRIWSAPIARAQEASAPGDIRSLVAYMTPARTGEAVLLERIARIWERRPDGDAVRQSGAIPYAVVDGQVTFLLVTSRRTGKWIFPKGTPIPGLDARGVAAREAFEEAGVEGELASEPIGSYAGVKVKGMRRTPILVDMYPLRVMTQHEDWPEKGQRHRHWVVLQEARRLLSEPQLVALAERLRREVLAHADGIAG